MRVRAAASLLATIAGALGLWAATTRLRAVAPRAARNAAILREVPQPIALPSTSFPDGTPSVYRTADGDSGGATPDYSIARPGDAQNRRNTGFPVSTGARDFARSSATVTVRAHGLAMYVNYPVRLYEKDAGEIAFNVGRDASDAWLETGAAPAGERVVTLTLETADFKVTPPTLTAAVGGGHFDTARTLLAPTGAGHKKVLVTSSVADAPADRNQFTLDIAVLESTTWHHMSAEDLKLFQLVTAIVCGSGGIVGVVTLFKRRRSPSVPE